MANVLIDNGNLTSIADAIRQKNKSETTYKPSQMAAAILAIDTDPSGDATATAADILSPKTAYALGVKLTGTITSKAAETFTPGTTDLTITANLYLSGAQTILGDADLIASNIKTGVDIFNVSGTFTSDANATSGDILLNKTGYVNGSKVTGTLANYDDTYIYLSSIAVTTPPTKTSYTVGDTLDLSGMVVTATYSDDTTEIITNYTTSPANGTVLTTEDTTITITHNGKTCTQSITITYPNYLCFTANTAGSTVAMSISGTPTLGLNFQYSTDRLTWTVFTPGTTTITLVNAGDKVYFKGNNPNGVNQSYSIYYNFVMTGSIAASGNIMSLIDNGACTTTVIPNNYCYRNMFRDCASLTTAPSLPATTLALYCYSDMFYECTSLITAPSLPATTLALYCYYYMFYRCTSLTTAPSLPATTLTENCYGDMFDGCTSLTTAPSLPATTLSDYCYSYMFFECLSLTTAPKLPATNLAFNCYSYMFEGCSSLIVSDTSGTGYDKVWIIPSSGTFTNTEYQNSMFSSCATGSGRSSNDMAGVSGSSYTYYTQNEPV